MAQREAWRAFRAALARDEQPGTRRSGSRRGGSTRPISSSNRASAYRLYRHRNDRASAARGRLARVGLGVPRRDASRTWLFGRRCSSTACPNAQTRVDRALPARRLRAADDADPRRALACELQEALHRRRPVRTAAAAIRRRRSADSRSSPQATSSTACGSSTPSMRPYSPGRSARSSAIGLSGCYLAAACERVRSQRDMWCTRLGVLHRVGTQAAARRVPPQYVGVRVALRLVGREELVRRPTSFVPATPMGGEGPVAAGRAPPAKTGL